MRSGAAAVPRAVLSIDDLLPGTRGTLWLIENDFGRAAIDLQPSTGRLQAGDACTRYTHAEEEFAMIATKHRPAICARGKVG